MTVYLPEVKMPHWSLLSRTGGASLVWSGHDRFVFTLNQPIDEIKTFSLLSPEALAMVGLMNIFSHHKTNAKIEAYTDRAHFAIFPIQDRVLLTITIDGVSGEFPLLPQITSPDRMFKAFLKKAPHEQAYVVWDELRHFLHEDILKVSSEFTLD